MGEDLTVRVLQLKILLPLIGAVLLLLAAFSTMAPTFCASTIVERLPGGMEKRTTRDWGLGHPCTWAYFGPQTVIIEVVPGEDPLAPRDVMENEMILDQRPRSEAIFGRFRSIDQLQSQVDFTIKFPDRLPRGFALKGAYESITFQEYEDYTINEITLIYWDKEVTGDADLEHASENGALFITILHAPGSSVDDFGPPPPPRAVGGAPEPVIPPGEIPELTTISGNPAIIGQSRVEIFVIGEETIYTIYGSRYTSEQLITILESTIRG